MTRSIQRLLIANRGEIAVRIARTCRALGITSVAVFSDADADAPHVAAADMAVRIGPAPSADSYLDIDRIIGACEKSGADAVHPGFGFLSENAEFAERCESAGLAFIGPDAETIRQMGSKQQAKSLAVDAGVPVVPGYSGADQSTGTLVAEAEKVGFPCLIKASAGGGGKGMRVVREAGDLEDAIASARREAQSGFGDDTLLIERYVERPRHIEVQILGDTHGNVVHLFERECSIQRRHQKVVEEAPAPNLDVETRDAMCTAAVRLAEAIGYRNAGTVEFILGPAGDFYFLEVNTRLQVEHPVTEAVTGVDLVAEQIRVAEGGELPFSQDEVTCTGSAMECRLYAEDPANDFLPASGPVVRFAAPERAWLRVDSGIESGSHVGIHYDPMLAKIITHGGSRATAHRRMTAALQELRVHGLRTNREFLIDLLQQGPVVDGTMHTHLLDELFPDGWSRPVNAELARQSAVAATLHAVASRRELPRPLPALRTGFRNNSAKPQTATFTFAGDESLTISWVETRDGLFRVGVGDVEPGRYRVVSHQQDAIEIEDDSLVQRRFTVVRSGQSIFVQSVDGAVELSEAQRFPLPGSEVPRGGSVAPMTGTVLEVNTAPGDKVEAGQTLVILEAMKMEHRITSAHAGVVASVNAEVGDIVSEGDVLVVVEDESDGE